MSLSDMAIRNAKPKNKAYKLYDGEGLFVIITPNGGKWWRMRYTLGGKEKTLSLGVYPGIGLKLARQRRDEARALIAQGKDPSQQRKEDKAAAASAERIRQNTFESVAQEWFAIYSPDLSEKHAQKLRRYLEQIFYPRIGKIPVSELQPAHILGAVQHLHSSGRIHSAHKTTQLAGQVLQYAFIKGLVPVNVGRGITGALQPHRPKNYPTITDPQKIGALLRAIDNYEGFPSIVFYLKTLPYIFTRHGELRLARWEEINFDDAMLTIPWQRMKTCKLEQKDHRVPLARQVIQLFRELHNFSGYSELIFPSIRAKTDTISDAGHLNVLRDMGYDKNTMCLHGFRAMASTRLNEMGIRADLIEAQLAHRDSDTIRSVYNRAEYLDERRKMMQLWADYLDELRTGIKNTERIQLQKWPFGWA